MVDLKESWVPFVEYENPRSKVAIMTKLFHHVNPERGAINATGQGRNTRSDSQGSTFETLQMLALLVWGPYIDLIEIYRLDREVSLEEVVQALNDVVEIRKARDIRANSMAAREFQMAHNVAEKHNSHKFISMPGFYNLLYREEEREMNPFCEANTVGLFPWSPLAAGILAHPWDDRTDERNKTDVFLKKLFRRKEVQSDKKIVQRV